MPAAGPSGGDRGFRGGPIQSGIALGAVNRSVSHAGVTSNCASCHETGDSWYAVTMVDRPTAAQDPNHPKTGDCSECHSSTTSFGVVTAGKPANHIPTVQACTLCHSNSSNYAVYAMNHAGITNNFERGAIFGAVGNQHCSNRPAGKFQRDCRY